MKWRPSRPPKVTDTGNPVQTTLKVQVLYISVFSARRGRGLFQILGTERPKRLESVLLESLSRLIKTIYRELLAPPIPFSATFEVINQITAKIFLKYKRIKENILILRYWNQGFFNNDCIAVILCYCMLSIAIEPN